MTPLFLNSVFDFPSIEDSLPALSGVGHVYRRLGSPNTDELGAAVAALEGAESGYATSSGMGAIATAVLSVCGAGDKIVVQRDAYGGTHALFELDLRRLGVEVAPVDAYDVAGFSEAMGGARVALVESVSNPLLRCAPIPEIARAADAAGVCLIVDNTFATPLRDQPLVAGAHLVVHSATKFLGGHHDLCAGVVVGDQDRIESVRQVGGRFGLGASPLDAWLAVRGIRTLELRMTRSWASAAVLAQRLSNDGRVTGVRSAPRCALIGFAVRDQAAADRVVRAFRMITLSPSLGGVSTTASHPASSSHRSMAAEERAELGIGDGFLRLSIGVEALEDIWGDLSNALAAAS